MRDVTKFKKGLDYIGITLNDRQIEQFLNYYELLVEKNKVMNLTAITEFDEVIEKHFIDSLLLAKVVDLRGNLKIIDLGTGAGFPGLPIKIAFPQVHMVLADSLNKRIKFLDEVIEALNLNDIGSIQTLDVMNDSGSIQVSEGTEFAGNYPSGIDDLPGIKTVHGRAEDLGRKSEYREQFDLCVSRAVANLATLSEYCLPFVKVGGYFVSYKSGNVDNELQQSQKAIHILSGDAIKCEKMSLPGTDVGRSFVIVRKNAPIHKKYPRKAGTPGKEPLS